MYKSEDYMLVSRVGLNLRPAEEWSAVVTSADIVIRPLLDQLIR
jgi:hypothetical protein